MLVGKICAVLHVHALAIVGVPAIVPVNVGEAENTRLLEVVPVAPDEVKPVMLLKQVMLAALQFVPPRATESCPDQPTVIEVACSNAVVGVPPNAKVTLVSSVLVRAAPPVMLDAAGVMVALDTTVSWPCAL